MNSIQKLDYLVEQLKSHLPRQEMINTRVSSSPVGWHIEHSLLVLDQVINQMAHSEPARYKRVFDYRRSVVIVFGYIPRGKIRAPKAVQPVDIPGAAALYTHLEQTKAKLKMLSQLGPGHYFTHPFLGDIKLKPATRFLCVHTKHHLGIIKEIILAKA